MSRDPGFLIADFLREHLEIFTVDDFYKYLKGYGVKISKDECLSLLHSSDFIFILVGNEFITRAGVFTGRWFSFKPSREEIEKGKIIIGHRFMPFINPDVTPDSVNIVANKKLLDHSDDIFSMNLAMDSFALYGEGYVIPYILNDKANDIIPLTSLQQSIPTEVKLTCWSLDDISPKRKMEYGDRILCRVVNWNEAFVEVFPVENDMKNMSVSSSAIQREEWYSLFENGLLGSFDRNGPGDSIEQQLAFLFLENQEELCVKNCGSCEEFLKHTKKIGFSSFGVETRIWRNGEVVPFIGEWNKTFAQDMVLSDISMTYSPFVIDAYILDALYSEATNGSKGSSLEELADKIFPSSLRFSQSERKTVMLNIEKRRDILKKSFNQFAEYPIVQIRKQILELFTKVNSLLCSIGCSELNIELFPQQEMIIISQLFSHLVKLIEEMQSPFSRSSFPVEEVKLSLVGMEETFSEIEVILKNAYDDVQTQSFEMVNKKKK